VEPIPEKPACVGGIIPRNVGPYPCKLKLSAIRLHIADEAYETPDTKDWILLGSQGVGVQIPAGHVNEIGVAKSREGRYRKNRVELSFTLHTTSVEGKFAESKSFMFEIDVLGEKPQALFRPEWGAA
jgi:hypothetical protein